MKNLFKLAYQLMFRGKRTMKFFTVLLSAFSFALFALASMGYTYNRREYALRNYMYELKQYQFLRFVGSTQFNGYLHADEISFIKENLPLDFLYFCDAYMNYNLNVSNYSSGDYYTWAQSLYDNVPSAIDLGGNNVYAGTPDLFKKAGYEIFGRFPTASNEVVINSIMFEIFKWGGYTYKNKTKEINGYYDLIGEKLDLRNSSVPNSGSQEVIIVGIFYVSNSKLVGAEPRIPILCSEAWRIEREQAGLKIRAIIAPQITNLVNRKFAEKCIEVDDALRERRIERYGSNGSGEYFGKGILQSYADELESSGLNYLAYILMGAGVLFLIFSVTLNAHLMTALIERKSKQIGLLRALGTPQKRIAAIFLIGVLWLATIIFLTSVGLTALVYYCFFKPWLLDGMVRLYPPFVFSGWTVLILFAVSFITPVLSVLLPIKKFFRSSVVENIKGTTSKKAKRN